MSESLIQAARRANRQFKDFMKQSGQALPLYRSITPEDLKKLSQTLEKVGALLGVEPLLAELDTELKSELGNYVSNLESFPGHIAGDSIRGRDSTGRAADRKSPSRFLSCLGRILQVSRQVVFHDRQLETSLPTLMRVGTCARKLRRRGYLSRSVGQPR